MLTLEILSVLSFRELLTLSILAITAIGVFMGLLLADRRRRRQEARKRHLDDIRLKCLGPLEQTLRNVPRDFQNNEYLTLLGLLHDPEAQKSYLATRKGISLLDWNQPRTDWDPLLYADMSNHFKDIYKTVEAVNEHLKSAYPRHFKLRMELATKIWQVLQPKLEGISLSEVRPQDALLAGFLYVVDNPEDFWGNLRRTIERNAELWDTIRTLRKEEWRQLVDEMNRIRDTVSRQCLEAAETIHHLMLSEKRLSGQCSYLP